MNDSESHEPHSAPHRFILLLRHGIAEPRGEGKADKERQLTRKGARRMTEIGQGLAGTFPAVEAIYTSPLVRAVQTGTALAKGYGGQIPIQLSEALEPGRDASEIRALLEALPQGRLIFIGHEPDLTRFLGDLCSLDTARMQLKKGGCYGIRIDATAASLEWMLAPGLLRRVKR